MRLQRSDMTGLAEELDILPSQIPYDSENGKTVLFKHDYYSSDSSYGRELLVSILSSLSCDADLVKCVILVDSAVRLLDSTDPSVLGFFTMLYSSKAEMFISGKSLSVYGITNTPEEKHIASDEEIADLIICRKPDLIIE